MERVNLLYARFLDHLSMCGGCTGPRKSERCKYAVVCAVTEVLGKKGLVANQQELLHYGTNHSSKYNYLPEGCDSSDKADSNVGPSSAE